MSLSSAEFGEMLSNSSPTDGVFYQALARMEEDVGGQIRAANEKLWAAAKEGNVEEIR